MTRSPRRRSVLYAPASNARALEKLQTLDCDGVILDLEDAVAPEAKAMARSQMVEAVQARRFGEREVIVRCNGLNTPWGAEDLAAIRQAAPDAVLLPKLNSAKDIAPYAALLPTSIPLWAMIETCAAVLDVANIARTPQLETLVLGSNDLLDEMGATFAAALHPAMAMTIMAARANSLSVLDGVHNDLADEAGLAASCALAAGLGFDGKTLIHPGQIAGCNLIFSPTQEQLEAAKAIIAAFAAPDAADKGAILVDGRMVERLHLARAQRLVAAHESASGA